MTALMMMIEHRVILDRHVVNVKYFMLNEEGLEDKRRDLIFDEESKRQELLKTRSKTTFVWVKC